MTKAEGLAILRENGIAELAKVIAKTMPCNCDLDSWEPERETGHSFVCRIHERSKQFQLTPYDLAEGVDLAVGKRGE